LDRSCASLSARRGAASGGWQRRTRRGRPACYRHGRRASGQRRASRPGLTTRVQRGTPRARAPEVTSLGLEGVSRRYAPRRPLQRLLSGGGARSACGASRQ
ncbi:MAG TPA: hypothetical protein VGC99_25850, partial [Candidatus Tectomicrobia bacterium]